MIFMKKSLETSLFSAFIFILLNEILYFFNFTNLTFSNIFHFQKAFYNYLILFVLIFIMLFLLSYCLSFIRLKDCNTYWFYIISCFIFIILLIVFSKTNHLEFSLQSAISLFLLVILTSYLFFYSIFYGNSVK
jgi:uncharacterized membrane protein YhaH (DUF805 family)